MAGISVLVRRLGGAASIATLILGLGACDDPPAVIRVPLIAPPLVQYEQLSSIQSVVAGGDHSCALSVDGKVKCWGRNDSGQLGSGNNLSLGDQPTEMGAYLPVVQLGTGQVATALVAGDAHTCALLVGGAVKCWGSNAFGQLGVGDPQNRGDNPGEMGDALPAVDLGTGRTATALVSGDDHTCALLDDASVKCWGDNDSGQLGLGNTTSRGRGPGEMGNGLPPVSVGTGRSNLALAAGSRHTCSLLDNNTVKCWGNNFNGQLGQGGATNRGDNPGEMGDFLAAVQLGAGRTALSVKAGDDQTCALLDNSTVKCWGSNAFGQLGQGDTANRGVTPIEMGNNLLAIPLGTGRTATAIFAGLYHNCARLDDGSLKCWGFNASGELGLGDTQNRGDGPGEMGDALPAVTLGAGRTATAVTAGFSHTCALLDDSTVKCWGDNTYGQLGREDTQARGDGPGEMGDALPPLSL